MGFKTRTLHRRRVVAADGWVLDVADLPSTQQAAPVVICGHAMMVDRRTMLRHDRPSLATTLAAAGFHVLVPDLRGHGMSGPTPRQGGAWTYADLVNDVSTLVELAHRTYPGSPIFLLGHSLFGHVALAWLGTPDGQSFQANGPGIAGVVLLAVNMWHASSWGARQSLLQRCEKAATMTATMALARARGFLPSTWQHERAMDETRQYWRTLHTSALKGRWASTTGEDYRASLAMIEIPALHVTSSGDRIYASPSEANAFLSPMPNRTAWRLGLAAHAESPHLSTEVQRMAPDHMGIVTRPATAPLWHALGQWLWDRCADSCETSTS